MKDPWLWDEDDLLALIQGKVQESIDLDYKGSAALNNTEHNKTELSKDVSAFANSAGGTIVYGVHEENHLPMRIDGGCDPRQVTREWLEQVISSRIQRKIEGVRIRQVDLTATNPGMVAYVVFVPQSTRAPHQASDKKFYKRFNFVSQPMEEYEVRDVSARSSVPDLSLTLLVTLATSEQATPVTEKPVRTLEVVPVISNAAATPAEHVVINLFIDSRLELQDTSGFSVQPGEHMFVVNGQIVVLTRLSVNWAVPGKMPVFQGVHFRVADRAVTLKILAEGDFALGWQLLAPRMSPRTGETVVSWNGSELTQRSEEHIEEQGA